MPDYRVTFARSARKELEKLDANLPSASLARLRVSPRIRVRVGYESYGGATICGGCAWATIA